MVALVERGTGRVRAMAMQRVTRDNRWKVISANMDTNATMMTDEANLYPGLVAKHETVKHRSGEYVRGNAHTNTVEGFFGLLKKGIDGVYHHVSRGHLQRYCDEFAFRYENRKQSGGDRAAKLMLAAEGKRLTYKQPASVS